MEKEQFETLRDLLIILLLKSSVRYEAIAEATDLDLKYLKNKYPMKKISRKDD